MQRINQTISQRMEALAAERQRRLANKNQSATKPTASSIEETVSITTSSIELPEAISRLNTGSAYWQNAKSNRYKKLIRDGFLKELLELTEMALTKDNPANWFATSASKAAWDKTLKFFGNAREIARTVAEVVKRLPVPSDAMNVVYKACWRVRGNAVRLAITAAETCRSGDPFKYFAWLVWKGSDKQLTHATAA